ncbi:MAG: Asp-tRNA(Asn)/Glu-tRNA(Gln) amidotransferase subunit GatC [Candidatus Bathyarchaeota archaeon]|nr:Asp-tRNA(Asn)/Glu-tRNA(Gln) amidotransferase subunit GatC [Candidatus Bathyarchaeota archaeon]
MRKVRISREQVEHIAELAHIELTEEEKNLFTEQFNRILEFFEKIDSARTNNVPPTYHVFDLVNVLRKDEVGEPLPRESILRNAPKREENFFKAPRII